MAPRYLPPGITSSDVIAAYEAAGADDYAASLVNLNNPGTHDLVNGGLDPTWDVAHGWTFPGTNIQYALYGPTIPDTGDCSVVISFSGPLTRQSFTAHGYLFGISGNASAYPFLAYCALDGHAGGTPHEVAWFNGNGATVVEGVIESGVIAIAGRRSYVDGVDQGITLAAWDGGMPADHKLSIGGLSSGVNSGTYRLGCKVQWMYVYNKVLSVDEIGDIVNPPITPGRYAWHSLLIRRASRPA